MVTNSDKYFDLKLKDSEELILNSRLMKEVQFRKRKFSIIEKQELKKYKLFCNGVVLNFLNIGTQIKIKIIKN